MIKRTLLFFFLALGSVLAKGQTELSDTVFVSRGTIVIFNDSVAAGSMASDAGGDCIMPAPLTAEQQMAQRKAMVNGKRTASSPVKVRFAWGADLGASIDMSGNDMSTIDLSLAFGMRRGWINFLGVGAQANVMISNSCRSFPIYLQFRTNFTDRPTRVFWELKGGMSLNFLEHKHRQEGIYGSTGVGFRLASTAKFSSHMVLGYTYLQRKRVIGAEMTHDFTDLHYATIKLGVVF